MSYGNFEIRKREERACRAIEKYGKTLWHYTDIGALNIMAQLSRQKFDVFIMN